MNEKGEGTSWLRSRSVKLGLAVIATVAIAICAITITHGNQDSDALFEKTFDYESLAYEVISEKDLTVKTYYYINSGGHIVIPPTVEHDGKTYTVICIGEGTFVENYQPVGGTPTMQPSKINSLEIPYTVTTIEKNAINNTLLWGLTIPETVKVVESNAIKNNRQLETLEILGSDTELKNNAIDLEQSLNRLVIPIDVKLTSSMIRINDVKQMNTLIFAPGSTGIGIDYTTDGSGFKYTDTLWHKLSEKNKLSIVFQNSVTYIGDNMLNGCKNVKELSFPSSLENIGENALNGFTFFKTDIIDMPANAENLRGNYFVGTPEKMVKWTY